MRVDGWRVVRRMLPRRWKRYLGITVLVVLLVRPDVAMHAALWIREERAQRTATVLTDMFSPGSSPVPQPAQPGQAPGLADAVPDF